jgi:hypothetical protein
MGLAVRTLIGLGDLDRTQGLVAAGDQFGIGARLLRCRGHALSYPLPSSPSASPCRGRPGSEREHGPGMPRRGWGYGRDSDER